MEHFVTTAFSKAERIEFWPGEDDKTPGMIVLVFRDSSTISNAIGCYQYLLDISGRKTHLLITPKGVTLDISIKDEEKLIDIPVENLAFSREQLKSFKEKCNPAYSFGLCLGEDVGEARPMLISADAKYSILSIFGYKLK